MQTNVKDWSINKEQYNLRLPSVDIGGHFVVRSLKKHLNYIDSF